MYRNDHFIKEYTHDTGEFPYLKNAPIRIDDYIGDLIEKGENMSPSQAADVKAILNEVAKTGMYKMSGQAVAKAAKLMLFYHMKPDDAVQLYNRYVGDWGGKSTSYRFDAIKDGKVVKTVIKAPMTRVCLVAEADRNVLEEKHSYDAACIRIEAVDENGNRLPFYNDPLIFEVKGEIELIGPSVVSMSGGACGTYVKTVGKKGRGELSVKTCDGVEQTLVFEVR